MTTKPAGRQLWEASVIAVARRYTDAVAAHRSGDYESYDQAIRAEQSALEELMAIMGVERAVGDGQSDEARPTDTDPIVAERPDAD